MTNERVALEPCPFCGGEAAFTDMRGENGYYEASVLCDGPASFCVVGWHTKEGAIARWNRRALKEADNA